MIIYTAAGTTRSTCDTFDYSGTHLGERKITASIQSATPIEFQIGDYFLFDTPSGDERFYLQTAPVFTRNHATLMLDYTAIFWWVGYELGLIEFIDVITGEPEQIYVKNNSNVAFEGNVESLAKRIKYNCQRAGYSSWDYEIDSSVDLSVRKDIVADNLKCWDVAQMIKSEFNLDFKINHDTRTLIVGAVPIVVQYDGDGFVFEYGIHKGLCDINRIQNEQKVITRLFVYGSERNIPTDYRTGTAHEYHPRLILPNEGAISGTSYVVQDGYIEDTALSAIYGVREDTYTNDRIYPTLDNPALVEVEPILDRPTEEVEPQYIDTVKEAWTEWVTTPFGAGARIPIHHPEEIIHTLVPTPSVDYTKFVVYINNPGFDLNDDNVKKEGKGLGSMMLQTGLLQAREFKIITCERKMIRTGNELVWDRQLYKITLERDAANPNYVLPNATITPVAGDTFTFLDINMPDVYVTNAEAKLLADALIQMPLRTKSPDGYSIKTPEEFVKRMDGIEAHLRESNAVLFRDTYLNIPERAVLIQAITISYKVDKLLPTYDLTISDTPIKNYISRIDAKLNAAVQKFNVVQVVNNEVQQNNLKSATVLQNTVINNNGNIIGGNIAPGSIQPSSLSSELRQTRYVLQAYFAVNHLGNANSAYGSTGVMLHNDADVVWGDLYNIEHQTWTITTPATFALETTKFYYVYIKGSLLTGAAEWVLSETKIRFNELEGFYMFEWGVVLPTRDGIRYSQNEHGINGTSAYVYVAYGTSLEGAGFTLTNNPALTHMSILTSPSEIEIPTVEMFSGLWWKRTGIDGGGGGGLIESGRLSSLVSRSVSVTFATAFASIPVGRGNIHAYRMVEIEAGKSVDEQVLYYDLIVTANGFMLEIDESESLTGIIIEYLFI